MEERIEGYFAGDEGEPPLVNSRMLRDLSEARAKRGSIVILSAAGLMWSLLFHALAFMLWRLDTLLGTAAFGAILASQMSAAVFAVVSIKHRKAVH